VLFYSWELASRACGRGGYGPSSFFSDFSTNENPLSADGRWLCADTTNQTVMKSTGGAAYGTQTSHPAPPYDDSNAYMLGFGNDHEVEGVVKIAGGLDSNNREIECLLRWFEGPLRTIPTYGDTKADGYEVNVQHQGAYLQIGRFKGTNFYDQPLGATPANGDRFRARIQGTIISVWWNDVLKTTFDISTAAADDRIATGNPGIGAFRREGASADVFGFESVTLRGL
jgi:hypothetical protein